MLKRLLAREVITKYLVAAILLIVPLYPKFPFIRVPGTFVSIRIEDFLLVLTAVVLVPIFFRNIKRFTQDKINKAIILCLAVGFISVLYAIFVTKTVVPHIGLLHWARRVEYFIPFFLGLVALSDKKNLEFYLKILIISISIMFVYGFGQKNFQWPIIVTQNLEYSKGVALRYIPGGHINSTFAGHYDLSTFLVFVLPIFVCFFFSLRGKSKFVVKMILFLTIFAGLCLIAFSGSRVSTVSYLLSVTIALVFIKKYKIIPVVLMFSLIIFSFSPSLRTRYTRLFDVTIIKLEQINKQILKKTSIKRNIVYAQDNSDTILERRVVATPTPAPPPVFEDRSTNIRLNVEWPRAIRALSKNPLLGTGYSSITLATDNDYLRMLGEVGILGFFSFWLIFSRLGKLLLDSYPFHKSYKGIELAFVSGMVGAIPGILTNAVFIDVFEASKFAIIFWLLIGLLVALLRKNKIWEII